MVIQGLNHIITSIGYNLNSIEIIEIGKTWSMTIKFNYSN
jgi:hypothetical protein